MTKKMITGCCGALLFITSAFSQVPATQDKQFCVQMFRIELSDGFAHKTGSQTDIGNLLSDNNKVTKFPDIWLNVGESVTNDQTSIIQTPTDYNLVNGVLVPTIEAQEVGSFLTVTLSPREDEKLDIKEAYRTAELDQIAYHEMEGKHTFILPSFRSSSISLDRVTEIGAWLNLRGLDETLLSDNKTVAINEPANKPLPDAVLKALTKHERNVCYLVRVQQRGSVTGIYSNLD